MDNTCITFEECGAPEEQLHCTQSPQPQAAEGEVIVRMIAAPINPADINYVQGVYGLKPQFPQAQAGLEGYGQVEQSRSKDLAIGDHVILLKGVGTWTKHLCAPAKHFLKIDEELDPQQAAMLKVNPLTAYLALTQYQQLKPGDWVVQNAANSGVGRCLIQLCRSMGLKSINLVRRADELRDELTALGADIVIAEDDENLLSNILEQTQGKRPKLASNCVGGESALHLMDILAPSGTLVTFGAMSKKSIKVPNGWLIFKDISLRGLWCTKWLQNAPQQDIQAAYSHLAKLMASGQLRQSIDSTYTLQQITQAVTKAQEEHRSGKILLNIS